VKKEKETVHNRYREEELNEMEGTKEEVSSEEVVPELTKEQQLENQVAQLKDQLLRNLAELENFKRRNNEERIKERKYASQSVFSQLIEAIDAFDNAFKVQTQDEAVKSFLKGFELVKEKLVNLLDVNEVKKIEAVGKPFDPNYHMAVSKIKVEGKESGIVVEELLPGYTYKDRILRPSMVIVNE
jgi:molecular chaperone GrpE